jgi:hypothetical protein
LRSRSITRSPFPHCHDIDERFDERGCPSSQATALLAREPSLKAVWLHRVPGNVPRMAMTFQPRVGEQLESALTPRAGDAGFELVQYETPLGQLVYEWRRGKNPGPQFLTRDLALLWMVEWLERDREQDALAS